MIILICVLFGLITFNAVIGLIVVADFSENYNYSTKTLWKIFFLWSYCLYLEIKNDFIKRDLFFPEKN